MMGTSRAISYDHVGRARLRVVRMQALVIDGRNCHRIDTVRITIEIALITVSCTVTAGKYEDGTFPTASVIDTIDDSLFDEISRTFHRFPIIRWTPTATIN